MAYNCPLTTTNPPSDAASGICSGPIDMPISGVGLNATFLGSHTRSGSRSCRPHQCARCSSGPLAADRRNLRYTGLKRSGMACVSSARMVASREAVSLVTGLPERVM
jgi:hypothetical protein